MKFILNTAVDPHFCALFNADGVRISYHTWENKRNDGRELWDFLKQYNISEITFLGGVSGPGGFSSLRVGAGVLNSLAFSLQVPVHSLRADYWQKDLLKNIGEVMLNSFGDGVWIRSKNDLVRKSVVEASEDFQDSPVCVNWLPEEKAKQFRCPMFVDMKNAPEGLLRLLERADSHPQCVTEYEVPPVG